MQSDPRTWGVQGPSGWSQTQAGTFAPASHNTLVNKLRSILSVTGVTGRQSGDQTATRGLAHLQPTFAGRQERSERTPNLILEV